MASKRRFTLPLTRECTQSAEELPVGREGVVKWSLRSGPHRRELIDVLHSARILVELQWPPGQYFRSMDHA